MTEQHPPSGTDIGEILAESLAAAPRLRFRCCRHCTCDEMAGHDTPCDAPACKWDPQPYAATPEPTPTEGA